MKISEIEVTYPRWISHITKERVYVQSAEEAEARYQDGYEPWPIVTPEYDAVKEKVMALEEQIEALRGCLSIEDRKRLMREVYGEAGEAAVTEGGTDTAIPKTAAANDNTVDGRKYICPSCGYDAGSPRALGVHKKTCSSH